MFAIASGISASLLSGAISGVFGGWLVAVAALSNPLLLATTFTIGAIAALAIETVEKSTEVWDGSKYRLTF